jgi:long-chain acyl-CoA synthetase
MIDWWGPILVEFYSGTEGGRTMITSADWLAHPGSVGRHWRGGRVWILDDGGRELAPGVDGRIYFEAPATGRFRYLNQPGATAAAYRGDRFTLGDVGHLDEEGWLYVTDRDSDMVISGGVNIYPREVENVLLEHPGVADAAVVGLPDDDLGERVVAAIEPREPASPVDPDDLIAFCRSRIAAFKCPKAVVFVDALNRSEAGKLDKRALEARLSSDDGSAG